MDDNLLAMQQAAQKRVERMQERSRRLCVGGPTFGAAAVTPVKQPAQIPKTDERTLLLLLILMLSQNGGSKLLLLLLGYLAL